MDLSDQGLSDAQTTDTTEEEDGLRPATPAADPKQPSDRATPNHPEARPILDELGKFWKFGKRGQTQLARPVSEALSAGHSAEYLLSVLLVNRGAVRRPVAVLAARLADLPEPRQKTPTITPKCDACNPSRWIEDPSTGHNIRKCPTCHPTHTQKAAA